MTGKTKGIILAGGLLLIILLCAVYFVSGRPAWRGAETWVDAADIIPHLKDGDIICRMGDRLWSLYVRNISPTDRRFSHVGIVRIRNENISVINAECLVNGREEKVNEVTLLEFLEVAKTVGVYRANFMESSVISDGAMQFLGLPFDWKFDLTDTTTVYCTELLHRIIKRNAPPEYGLKATRVKELGKSIIPLEAISNSNNFDEIVYVDSRR